MTLWHYTCEHGREELGDGGLLLPAVELTSSRPVPWTAYVVWLTDLTPPDRDALGLTSRLLTCDRTAHRYRVTDEANVVPWHVLARTLTREMRDELEAARGARPAHWYISAVPVPALYDP